MTLQKGVPKASIGVCDRVEDRGGVAEERGGGGAAGDEVGYQVIVMVKTLLND